MKSPGILDQSKEKLPDLCNARGIDQSCRIIVRSLSANEAIGEDALTDFAIKKGKERVIEATFAGVRGQAFTDQPSEWHGTLQEVLALDLSHMRNRAIFVAYLNAVLRSLGMAFGTCHCLDNDPVRCGPVIADSLAERFGHKRFGLIGFQPAILEALMQRFGSDYVRAIDLNPDNIGATKFGIPIWDGVVDLPRIVGWCQVGLATGSSVVNGSIDEIRRRFEEASKPLIFFGNTIAGVAVLMELERICPFGR